MVDFGNSAGGLRPGEEWTPLLGRSFWESSPPMGPPENPTGHPENQEGRRKRLPRRPRKRRCLLKGCEQRFPPRQARQRYCSQECREAAREWSRWKAQERFTTLLLARLPASVGSRPGTGAALETGAQFNP